MRKLKMCLILSVVIIFMALPAFAQDDTAKKMSDVLMKGMAEGHWQVTADEIYMWIKTKKADFLVVDVRPRLEEYKEGHIPGAIYIPYNEILKPENLKKLPKDKKIVLICATGQLQNLPIVPLRVLGYDAYTMAFGYSAWIKGYGGGEAMKRVINKAATKNYPIKK
ncbi:MAG: rhodanese-like domain-containing protein [Nitrospirota bacterium]